MRNDLLDEEDIWTEINPNSPDVIYTLNRGKRTNLHFGILTAQFNLNKTVNGEGIIHTVDGIFPAKLSTSINIDEITFRLSVNIYDEQEAKEKIDQRTGGIFTNNADKGCFPPADEDVSWYARELRAIYQFQELLERHQYVTFPSCQRLYPKGKPLESDPHRPLEDREIQLLLPYIDAIFESMRGVELKKPLNTVGYYQKMIKRILKK